MERQNTPQWLAFIQVMARHWRWYLRLMVLWWALSSIAPVTHRVLPQPPQVVHTLKPLVCVHTDLIHEPDEWKVQRTLQLVREMGADTIVEFFPWAYIEHSQGAYNWAHADLIVEHAENQGVQIIARMGLVPGWARPRESTLNHIPDESFADFADFVARFATRYTGRVDKLIIWNEPNLAFEWGYQDFSPARYTEMLKAVYPAAKAASPQVIILAGALSPTIEPPGSPHGLDDLLYLAGMYEAGAAPYFDALALHTYGFTEPPQASPMPQHLNFRRAELLYEIMQQHEAVPKPVYITESGWNDHPRWVKGVRPSQRIAHTLQAYTLAESTWPWLEQLCLWIFRHPREHGNYRDNFPLVTSEFQLKPIYYALQAYARGWEEDEVLWLPPPQGS